MGTRERTTERVARIARETTARLGRELRQARVNAGLSQRAVAAAIRMSHSQVGRVERGELRSPSIDQLMAIALAVDLELSIRTYPAGDPLRDAGQAAVLARFERRLHPSIRFRREVPLPIPGDRRAWDGFMTVQRARTGIEAETRITDAQALERRIALKARDGEVDHVILVVADTRHNRAVLQAARETLRASFPLDTAGVLEALVEGRSPGASGIVVL